MQLGEVVAAGAVGTVHIGTVEGVERAIKVITCVCPLVALACMLHMWLSP